MVVEQQWGCVSAGGIPDDLLPGLSDLARGALLTADRGRSRRAALNAVVRDWLRFDDEALLVFTHPRMVRLEDCRALITAVEGGAEAATVRTSSTITSGAVRYLGARPEGVGPHALSRAAVEQIFPLGLLGTIPSAARRCGITLTPVTGDEHG